MALGGALWYLYGLSLMEPMGAAVVWREELRYTQILQTGLWVLYSLPGILAVVLTAGAGLVALPAWASAAGGRWLRQAGRALLVAALGFAALAVLGLAVRLDAPVTGGLSFGTVALGTGMLLGGLGLRRAATGQQGTVPALMIAVGLLGVLSLLMWPLLYALRLLPVYMALIVYAVFGLSWAVLGLRARDVAETGL